MAWAEGRGNSWRVRYLKPDGTLGSLSGFPTKKAAENHADTLESEQRRGIFHDPQAGQTTITQWVTEWLDALDVAGRTEENYRSILRNHILPQWADTALADITALKVATWSKRMRATGLAPVTVGSIVKLLSLVLADAVDEKLISANPITRRRRGRQIHRKQKERVWATPIEVLHIADQAAALYGPGAGLLILTAAYTGARWGELVGLQRHNLHLDRATLRIDPDIGALHETNTGLVLGPPKNAESARTITLPPFLVHLLRTYLDTHSHPHVFVTIRSELHRRSNFTRRAMRPSADGNLHVANPQLRVHPIKPGLTFHGLRHSHKTWLIADGIPEIAQSKRLGHKLPDKIQETYSHVADEVERRLMKGLKKRWKKSRLEESVSEVKGAWRSVSD